jgi:hypothetical protein
MGKRWVRMGNPTMQYEYRIPWGSREITVGWSDSEDDQELKDMTENHPEWIDGATEINIVKREES